MFAHEGNGKAARAAQELVQIQRARFEAEQALAKERTRSAQLERANRELEEENARLKLTLVRRK